MNDQQIIQHALRQGASHARPVDLRQLKFYPELLSMCEMNTCGAYGTTWGCPPGCGDVQNLIRMVSAHQAGVVFQYIGQLEDSFDYEGMQHSGHAFARIASGLKELLAPSGYIVMGAGQCHICEACTYPDAPCRHPDKCTVPVEASGINVSELCALAELHYIHGVNTVTYTGLVVLPVDQ